VVRFPGIPGKRIHQLVPSPAEVGRQLLILVDGGIVTASITKDPDAANHAQAAAARLLT
jgi:hypothetical protein